MNVLNRHAPIKAKKIRGNNAPFMNKTLSKYNKFPTGENKRLYN